MNRHLRTGTLESGSRIAAFEFESIKNVLDRIAVNGVQLLVDELSVVGEAVLDDFGLLRIVPAVQKSHELELASEF